MTTRPITTWAACVRCLHGDAAGQTCTAPQLRLRGVALHTSTDQARSAGLCGLQADWHQYRPAPAGALPILALAA